MFTNYSQTYAAAVVTAAGLLVTVLSMFHVTVLPQDIEFVLGLLINFGGVIWTLVHRNKKGDVTPLGRRIS